MRLTHPFPSVLDGLVCTAAALVAGGGPLLAIRIGVAMTLLQLGIGTVNDIVDAPRDAGRKPGKPIPAGLVPEPAARILAVSCFGVGTLLGATVSGWLALLACVVVGVGLAYDLRLKGTAWSWLPFAAGIPILPVFGWVGAADGLPSGFLVLGPAAVAAGAALAIGNALVDTDRDRAAGVSSIAVALGERRAGRVAVGLLAGVWVAAVASSAMAGAGPIGLAAIALAGAVPIGAAAASPAASTGRRERAWQVEAIGLAILATAWIAAVLTLGSRPA